MPGEQTDRRERSGDNFEESPIFRDGLTRAQVDELLGGRQLISPRAQEIVYGNNRTLGPNSVAQLLSYDRLRVRATVLSDGRMRIGNREEVTSGGGFILPPAVAIQIQAIGEVWVGTDATQQTVSVMIESEGGDVV